MAGYDHCKEIIFGGEKLILSPLRAAYWPAQSALIIADLHLGKSAYFRSNGIAIPSTVMMDDLRRLSRLIENYAPKTIFVAGDMFHHDYNTDISFFKEWRNNTLNTNIVLIPGNHDQLPKVNYHELQISVSAVKHTVTPFLFEHETTTTTEGSFHISGHLHPGYTIAGKARQSLRLPCFIQTPQQLILPAFSAFTGLFTNYQSGEERNYFVIGGGKVFRI